MKPKVVIIGGGFGGLNAAKSLKNADVEILLIDRTNHHLFQPLLYQVASAALSPGNIAQPLRELFFKQKNINVIMGNVVNIDKEKKEILLTHGDRLSYDYLIVATGARHSYFGRDEWESYAPGLKSISDAIGIREKVLLAFEKAERIDDKDQIAKYLRFVVVGGGPTGVEMSGAIAEIAHQTLFKNFQKIKPEHSEIHLIEGNPRLLKAYPSELSEIAKKDLEKMGVQVHTNTRVTNISQEGVFIGDQLLATTNIIWAAGVRASPMLKTLGVPMDYSNRVVVGPDLTIPDHEEVFVIGDAAHLKDKEGHPLPGIASVAIQQGHYVAKIIHRGLKQKERPPFCYSDKGTIATIGRAKAVGQIGKRKISGFSAWLVWCFVHIFYLTGFPMKMLVMFQWFSWYMTGERPVRLISKPIDEEEYW